MRLFFLRKPDRKPRKLPQSQQVGRDKATTKPTQCHKVGLASGRQASLASARRACVEAGPRKFLEPPLEPVKMRLCPQPRPLLRTRMGARAGVGWAWPGAVLRQEGGARRAAYALGLHGDRTRPATAAALARPHGAVPAARRRRLGPRESGEGSRGRGVQVTLGRRAPGEPLRGKPFTPPPPFPFIFVGSAVAGRSPLL